MEGETDNANVPPCSADQDVESSGDKGRGVARGVVSADSGSLTTTKHSRARRNSRLSSSVQRYQHVQPGQRARVQLWLQLFAPAPPPASPRVQEGEGEEPRVCPATACHGEKAPSQVRSMP